MPILDYSPCPVVGVEEIMLLPRIVILFNEPTLPPDHPDAESEHDILYTADCVAKCLTDAGLPVSRLGVTDDPAALLAGLKQHRPDVVFNLYEGTAKWGNTEAFVCGILELLRIPFTGSPTQPLILCRSKPLTKQLLAGAGLPTAPFFAVESLPVPPCPLPWPVIVKPGTEDASVGIEQASVVTSQEQLEARVRYVLDNYGAPALVERFIRGREFNVAVWDRDGTPQTLPFSEILFIDHEGESPLWPIVSFDAKWHPNSRDYKATPAKNPADVTPELHAAVAEVSVRAFHLAGCRDYARIDLRVADDGTPYILEVNPNPCISPLAGLAAGLESARVPYEEFILSLVRSALRRGPRPELAEAIGSGLSAGSSPTPDSVLPAAVEPRMSALANGWQVRAACASDAGNLFDLTTACDALTGEDRIVLVRRLREELARSDRPDAGVFVLESREGIGGFALLTPDNVAHGVYMVAAVVVDPSQRRRGCGRLLLAAVEQAAATAGGRILTVDVSSGSAAAGLRQFLTRVGYRSAGEVPDFYKDGSSRLTYTKELPPVTTAPTDSQRPATART
jgi:D-alanine-D-alanine ligase